MGASVWVEEDSCQLYSQIDFYKASKGQKLSREIFRQGIAMISSLLSLNKLKMARFHVQGLVGFLLWDWLVFLIRDLV